MNASKRDKEDFKKTQEYSAQIVKLFKDRKDFDPAIVFAALSMCMVTLGRSMDMTLKMFISTLAILAEDYKYLDTLEEKNDKNKDTK